MTLSCLIKGIKAVAPEQTRTSDIFVQSIFNTVHNFNGKVKKVADLIGMDSTVLSNKCNPSNVHKLTIQELHDIITATKDYQSLIALSLEFSHACVQNNLHHDVDDMDIMASRTHWEIERAATCKKIDAAISDEKITEKELISIKQAMYSDFHKELSLLIKLRGLIQNPQNTDLIPAITPTFKNILEIINHSIDNYSEGIDELSKKMNTIPGILKNKCSSDNKQNLNIYELRNIIKITGTIEILHTFCESLNHTCIEIRDFSAASNQKLLSIRTKWDAERGETDKVIEEALRNHVITEEECKKIQKEMCEDFQWEIEVLSRLELMCNNPATD